MKIFQKISQLKSYAFESRRKKKTVGFVPTMGALHEGHLSLVRLAKKENKRVVVSIFVNPLQFEPQDDFWRYPRDLVRDTKLLLSEKVDVLFTPNPKEFYSGDFGTSVSVKKISLPLCGISRPAHFAGVATVVLKLLNLVQPNALYLGQKDYQQVRVIEQMIKDLELDVRVRVAPIVREKNGLAMSSRNSLLKPIERQEAAYLYEALTKAKELIESGIEDPAKIKKLMNAVLKDAAHGRIDYLEIVDPVTLESLVKLKNKSRSLIALAVFFGKTRLIDNSIVDVP